MGYYLEFDVAMLNRVRSNPCWAWACRSPGSRCRRCTTTIKFRQLPPYRQHDNADIDLRLPR